MAMEIRPLKPNDAAALWELRLQALQNEPFAFGEAAEEHQGTSVETYRERLRASTNASFSLGAFEGDVLIGMARFTRRSGSKEQHKGLIQSFYVSQPFRGRGAGRALMEEALRRARLDPSLEQVMLAVSIRQEAARHLYSSLGFKVFGREPRSLKVGQDYIDEEHMVLLFE
jgi:ribosomal protein S18 acetylase RimI-like enzyme